MDRLAEWVNAEEELHGSMKAAAAAGRTMISIRYGVSAFAGTYNHTPPLETGWSGSTCALGSYLLGRTALGGSPGADAAVHLGVKYDWCQGINGGFAGMSRGVTYANRDDYEDGYQTGLRLRREFIQELHGRTYSEIQRERNLRPVWNEVDYPEPVTFEADLRQQLGNVLYDDSPSCEE